MMLRWAVCRCAVAAPVYPEPFRLVVLSCLAVCWPAQTLLNGSPAKDEESDDDDMPEVPSNFCSKCLFWSAAFGSCCTFPTTHYVKATLWRTRIVLMLIYVPLLLASALFMYLYYDGYEKMTVLDDRGTAPLPDIETERKRM